MGTTTDKPGEKTSPARRNILDSDLRGYKRLQVNMWANAGTTGVSGGVWLYRYSRRYQ